ncbi:MAG TPA: hypothetical protein VJN92_07545 [Candidatus Acidoferrum sp.]|nr:hypothetical protein [Candidatus Acidoferrum sp.]
MNSFLLRSAILGGLLCLSLGCQANAQSTDNDGCSNATLHGDYAFTVSGQIFIPNGPVIQREGIAMTHFDGVGGLSQVDVILSSPNSTPPPGTSPVDPVTGFHTQETGTYVVYADCTGTFTINFPSLTTPTGASIPGAVIVVKFVLSNGGRAIYTIVTSLTPPGAPSPVPALIRSEGHKLLSLIAD